MQVLIFSATNSQESLTKLQQCLHEPEQGRGCTTRGR